MKIKLSKAQLYVMFELRNGNILHMICGLNARWFFHHGYSINCRTIFKLEDFGFIKRDDENYPKKQILTDKGRTYLDEISQTQRPKGSYPL